MRSDLKIKLENLVRQKDWDEYISTAKDAGVTDVDLAVEAIFLLFTNLVYPQSNFVPEYKQMMKALEHLFQYFLGIYKDNAKFLFFVGYFNALSEWAFGQEDFGLSHEMLRKAFEIEPENILYEWGYRFSTGDPQAESITERLYLDRDQLSRLMSTGAAGRFIAEAIETAYESYKKRDIFAP